MKKILLFFTSLYFLTPLTAQTFHRLDIPVTTGGEVMLNPWAGGLNAPQWANIDLNNDGLKDIYIFDRNGFVNLGFLNTGGTGEAVYEFAPYWVGLFPQTNHFVLMRDYNRDGAADFFGYALETGAPPGIKVYKGKFGGNRLAFERVLFPQNDFDVIPYHIDDEVFDIELNPVDYPAIDDLDGDGDLDILVLGVNGDRVNYFENVALESGFTDDSLLYEPGDDCWGKFQITPFSQSLDLSPNPNDCGSGHPGLPSGNPNRLHGGASLTTFDADNDGDKEALYGDLIFPNLTFLQNNGTPEAAWMTAQTMDYPADNVPIDIELFPASYLLDIDNDGADDLIASPNLANGTPDREVAWYYRNTGGAGTSDFELVKKNFLVETMLDFGTGAYPAFADVNADGLMDLVVGNRGEWAAEFIDSAYVVLFLNTGTPTEPAFELVDENWLNFRQFTPATKAFTPAFGDLDGDGDVDLITGDDEGGLFYAENTAGPGQPMAFGPVQLYWKNIFIGRSSTPVIHDINKDGLADLVIGERNGTVNYLPNIGEVGNPDFHPDPDEAPNNNFFGKIDTRFGGFVGYSSPKILEFDTEMFLITGSNQGWLSRYRINADSIDSGAFELLDEKFGNLRDGNITCPAFTELNGDMYLDMVLGNDRGGLGIFQSPITIDGLVGTDEIAVPELEKVRVYPNPVSGTLQVALENINHPSVSYFLFDTMGRMAESGEVNGNAFQVNMDHFTPGIYFLQIRTKTGTIVKRIVNN